MNKILFRIFFLISLAFSFANCYYGSVEEMKAFIEEEKQIQVFAETSTMNLLLDLKDEKIDADYYNQTEIDEIDRLIEEEEEKQEEMEAMEIEEIEEMNAFNKHSEATGNYL